jgi:hypothetical protein
MPYMPLISLLPSRSNALYLKDIYPDGLDQIMLHMLDVPLERERERDSL